MKFKKLRFKNILSFGNKMTEIDLSSNEIVLISGTNGNGKSAIMDSLYFAFTGKPYRKIKKKQLINTSNEKGLLVELEIEHSDNEYLIKRGMLPNIFEIYKNGKLIDEDSHMKDYQVILEQILGMSAETFKQTMIMSSRFYKPFLEFNKGEKREFLENILSIRIFTIMNDNLKKNSSDIRQEVKMHEKDIFRVESNIKLVKDFIDKEESAVKERMEQIKDEINKIKLEVAENEDNIASSNEKSNKLREKITEFEKCLKNADKVQKKIGRIRYQIEDIEKSKSFYVDNKVCPTCGQDIDEHFSAGKLEEIAKKYEKKVKELEEVQKVQEKLKQVYEKNSQLKSSVAELERHIAVCKSNISNLKKRAVEYKSEYNKLSNPEVETSSDIEIFEKEKQEIQATIDKMAKDRKYINLTLKLLSEKGIKKFILNKYIPVLNQFVNEYLKFFDAPYNLLFDEEIEEKIVARGYEDLSYGNFSAGEKQRVDLAMLFSFLDLSRLKNSVKTNLIFFDEVLDSSLDGPGIDSVFKIFRKMKKNGYTILVISHRENIEDRFDKVINIEKKKFSYIKED